MDWIHFTQDRDHWQVLVSGAMNLQGPWKVGDLIDATIKDFTPFSYLYTLKSEHYWKQSLTNFCLQKQPYFHLPTSHFHSCLMGLPVSVLLLQSVSSMHC
jgi:hypothetical protein